MRTIINTQNSRNRIRYLLVIAFIGMIAVMASTADARPKNPLVRKAIHRTHILIVHAAKAAKKGGQDKTDLRKAVVNQRAARWCLNHDKPQEAAVLTLMARALARKVILSNKAELPKGTETDTAEETRTAANADQALADAFVVEADITTH